MRLDLADLQLFLCIVDAGSITAGAASANLALASASERLRNIESAAGVALLERRPRGVVTTEAGEALAHHARLILRQQEMLKGELQDFAAGARGTLHLYANTAALIEFLPSRLAPWLAARPRLRIELKERTSTEIVRAVAAGLIEAGVISDAIAADGLQVQAVARDHLVVITAAQNTYALGKQVTFADVLGLPFVGLSQGSALQDHIDEHARAAGRPFDLRIRMKTFEGLCEMVAHGVGIGIVPQSIAKRYRRRYSLHVVALQDGWAQRQLCLCFKAWGELSGPMQSLLAHLGGRPGVV
ncbi:LysR substrate-binding domain-containing protein [Pseudomonas putida]|uniref:LysR family transcriptional regulator n=1 Tax=Pseudomonas putida TaxID=303 RepID=UPI002D1EB3C8|nr:LysR substrate-binding domain-containing protein [Pseudomonas putida]MEB3899246.1 LysR substrate-binding domain-containing protein [Pseudomonas putida]